jgi:enterobactin synthetase component D
VNEVMFQYIESPRLFPPIVRHVSAIFHRDLWITLQPTEAAVCIPVVGHAVLRRRSEYVAGRRCAARALEMHLTSGPLDLNIVGRRPDRTPIWPHGIVGSITHTEGYAAAAVGGCDRVRSIGIDSEVLLAREHALEIRSSIGRETEIKWISAIFERYDDSGITVLFSAKESLFKCLFPIVSSCFSFLDVHLVDADATKGTITLELRTDLGGEFQRGWRAVGSVQIGLPYVHTGFMLPTECVASSVRARQK